MIKIILLDVDGVLVQPGGYRAALRATVNYFKEPHFEIDEETLAHLEKRGISSEWDMSPLLLAAYWNEILSRQTMQDLPADVFAAAIEINRRRKVDSPMQLFIPEFPFVPGQYPAETAFRSGCFADIPIDLRRNLLTGTRDIRKSATMRIFQHFALGSKQFTETYDLPALFETGSFLRLHDRSNVDHEVRAKLCQSNHYLVAFTSRPSRPPREIGESTIGYAPEAELALELVGLEKLPLIAFGKLEYLASKYHLDPATLVKPSPTQALAAILAAWTGEEWASLQAAYHWHQTGELNNAFSSLPRSFELIVVEDTMGGIISTLQAGEILQGAGIDVTVRAFGLTSGSATKASAFQTAGIPFFEDWKSLIDEI